MPVSVDKGVAEISSPPTLRVVSVVEFLAAHRGGQSSAQIADALALNRSTAGAILTTLDACGWVTRLPDLSYELGPALIPINQRARETLPKPGRVAAELERLADRVGCAAGLSTIHRDQLMVVALTGDRGPVPAGIAAGIRVPLHPSSGAAMIAYADTARRTAWLHRADIDTRTELEHVLTAIRTNGVGMWGLGANMSAMTLIAQVLRVLPEHPSNSAVNERLIALFTSLIGSAYDLDHLTDEAVTVSLITAPVFNADGDAQWELQIAPFDPALPNTGREHMITEIKATAQKLSHRRDLI